MPSSAHGRNTTSARSWRLAERGYPSTKPSTSSTIGSTSLRASAGPSPERHSLHRRVAAGNESLPPDVYESLKYYERWAAGAEIILIEKGILTREEIDAKTVELDERWS